jgi:peptidoglycan-associated lipoprotein
MLFFVLTLVVACAGKKKTSVESEVAEVAVSDGDRVYFDFDKYNLKSEAVATLDGQAKALKTDTKKKVTIEGHCDERGTRDYNYGLGRRRANAVKDYLVKKGIAPARIKTVSYGKDRPQVQGTGEEVWAKNRVAITVEK